MVGLERAKRVRRRIGAEEVRGGNMGGLGASCGLSLKWIIKMLTHFLKKKALLLCWLVSVPPHKVGRFDMDSAPVPAGFALW